MVQRWFVKCKTCATKLADRDSSFNYDPNQPHWENPQWKSVIKCPRCGDAHQYSVSDLELGGSAYED